MKRLLVLTAIMATLHANSQSVFGYWYGYANVKTKSSANNYLVELVLQPGKDHVNGVLNYYFKNTYRSIQVKGNFNPKTRLLSLYNIPVTYYGSFTNFEVDCQMNLQASLRVAQAGSNLVGSFIGLPDYKYTCPDLTFNLVLNADISKKDSVLRAISEFKENYQVWKPTATDTLVAVDITERKVINYVTEKEFKERENQILSELEIESDTVQMELYDNGEVDGDIISVFYNQQLILNNQKLTHKSIRIKLKVDSTKAVNELSMFAENLGLIPPNTALMVIVDGKNRHEIRLSSTLQRNGTIRLKRKPAGP
jgi:hypothetical protein